MAIVSSNYTVSSKFKYLVNMIDRYRIQYTTISVCVADDKFF
jgi:hypothetical protein